MLSLFKTYPQLKDKFAYLKIAELPTPVEKLENICNKLNTDNIYIKRDDLTNNVYGGNKIRKLEFTLGDALKQKAKKVITFGYAGSNHALATAIHANLNKIKATSILLPQENASYLRKNLLYGYVHNAKLLHYKGIKLYTGTIYQVIKDTLKNLQVPTIIPPGGSSPLGTLGYVNAAFELKNQIDNNELPIPDYIYVASGSLGTSVGLILGLKLLDLKTKVVGVRVVPEKFCNKSKMINLFHKTKHLIKEIIPNSKHIDLKEEEIIINHDFFGDKYAKLTKEGVDAVNFMKEHENIQLDGTYSGKAFAALLRDLSNPDLREKNILFWNTYNSVDFSENVKNIDYKQLPKGFYPYFENDVQIMDKEIVI